MRCVGIVVCVLAVALNSFAWFSTVNGHPTSDFEYFLYEAFLLDAPLRYGGFPEYLNQAFKTYQIAFPNGYQGEHITCSFRGNSAPYNNQRQFTYSNLVTHIKDSDGSDPTVVGSVETSAIVSVILPVHMRCDYKNAWRHKVCDNDITFAGAASIAFASIAKTRSDGVFELDFKLKQFVWQQPMHMIRGSCQDGWLNNILKANKYVEQAVSKGIKDYADKHDVYHAGGVDTPIRIWESDDKKDSLTLVYTIKSMKFSTGSHLKFGGDMHLRAEKWNPRTGEVETEVFKDESDDILNVFADQKLIEKHGISLVGLGSLRARKTVFSSAFQALAWLDLFKYRSNTTAWDADLISMFSMENLGISFRRTNDTEEDTHSGLTLNQARVEFGLECVPTDSQEPNLNLFSSIVHNASQSLDIKFDPEKQNLYLELRNLNLTGLSFELQEAAFQINDKSAVHFIAEQIQRSLPFLNEHVLSKLLFPLQNDLIPQVPHPELKTVYERNHTAYIEIAWFCHCPVSAAQMLSLPASGREAWAPCQGRSQKICPRVTDDDPAQEAVQMDPLQSDSRDATLRFTADSARSFAWTRNSSRIEPLTLPASPSLTLFGSSTTQSERVRLVVFETIDCTVFPALHYSFQDIGDIMIDTCTPGIQIDHGVRIPLLRDHFYITKTISTSSSGTLMAGCDVTCSSCTWELHFSSAGNHPNCASAHGPGATSANFSVLLADADSTDCVSGYAPIYKNTLFLSEVSESDFPEGDGVYTTVFGDVKNEGAACYPTRGEMSAFVAWDVDAGMYNVRLNCTDGIECDSTTCEFVGSVAVGAVAKSTSHPALAWSLQTRDTWPLLQGCSDEPEPAPKPEQTTLGHVFLVIVSLSGFAIFVLLFLYAKVYLEWRPPVELSNADLALAVLLSAVTAHVYWFVSNPLDGLLQLFVTENTFGGLFIWADASDLVQDSIFMGGFVFLLPLLVVIGLQFQVVNDRPVALKGFLEYLQTWSPVVLREMPLMHHLIMFTMLQDYYHVLTPRKIDPFAGLVGGNMSLRFMIDVGVSMTYVPLASCHGAAIAWILWFSMRSGADKIHATRTQMSKLRVTLTLEIFVLLFLSLCYATLLLNSGIADSWFFYFQAFFLVVCSVTVAFQMYCSKENIQVDGIPKEILKVLIGATIVLSLVGLVFISDCALVLFLIYATSGWCVWVGLNASEIHVGYKTNPNITIPPQSSADSDSESRGTRIGRYFFWDGVNWIFRQIGACSGCIFIFCNKLYDFVFESTEKGDWGRYGARIKFRRACLLVSVCLRTVSLNENYKLLTKTPADALREYLESEWGDHDLGFDDSRVVGDIANAFYDNQIQILIWGTVGTVCLWSAVVLDVISRYGKHHSMLQWSRAFVVACVLAEFVAFCLNFVPEYSEMLDFDDLLPCGSQFCNVISRVGTQAIGGLLVYRVVAGVIPVLMNIPWTIGRIAFFLSVPRGATGDQALQVIAHQAIGGPMVFGLLSVLWRMTIVPFTLLYMYSRLPLALVFYVVVGFLVANIPLALWKSGAMNIYFYFAWGLPVYLLSYCLAFSYALDRNVLRMLWDILEAVFFHGHWISSFYEFLLSDVFVSDLMFMLVTFHQDENVVDGEDNFYQEVPVEVDDNAGAADQDDQGKPEGRKENSESLLQSEDSE